MNDKERVAWAQQCVDTKNPEVWQDIAVPKDPSTYDANVPLVAWCERLAATGMVGTYRAHTTEGRLLAVLVTESTTFKWEVKDIIKG